VFHVQPNASGVMLKEKIESVITGLPLKISLEIHSHGVNQRLELVESP
jgi:hypothetical protein